ncbi:MAG: YitT family protein [Acholeplasmataceae bacterium]
MNRRRLKEWTQISLGVFVLSVGFYFFLLPQALVIGGVMGVAVFFRDVIPVSLFIYIINGVLLVIGLIFLGGFFFWKTVYASLLSPSILFVFELFIEEDVIMKHLTESPLLIGTGFGGLLVGLGLGMVLRNNGTTGGIDIIQKIANKYLKIPFSWAMYATDGTIILIAMIVDLELGLYATFAMLISGFVIDRVAIDGRPGYTVFIVTLKGLEIQQEIYRRLKRGLTRVRVIGGYSGSERDMIICTVNRIQLYSFKLLIKDIDPEAFTFVTKTKEALGEGFSREAYAWQAKG